MAIAPQTPTDNRGPVNAKPELEAAIWRAFTSPGSEEEFYQAWLSLLCRQLAGIKAGVILLQAEEANTFKPVAVWPDVGRDLAFLGPVAQRALTEARGVTHRPTDSPEIHVAYPIEISGRMLASVVLEVMPRSDGEVHALLRQLHWGSAWLLDMSRRRELNAAEGKLEQIGSVMEIVASGLRAIPLQQALFDLANQVANYLEDCRVAIGLSESGVIRVAAFSSAAWFEEHAQVVKLYAAAMEEAADRLSTVVHEAVASDEPNADEPSTAHGRLARETGAQAILSIPLRLGSECLGVLTVERSSRKVDTREGAWIEALSALLPSLIDQKRRADRGVIGRLRDDLRALLSRFFGPRYLIWKFSAAAALLLVIAMAVIQIDYRVSAKTVIEGEIQRSAVAPFEGFIAASYVRAGDAVRVGQVLCALDDRDLRLEQQKWTSEREQASRKLREAMANHDLANVQILAAQVQESEAQLALANERLARAKIIAPFDGIVISGDLSQLIGSPVEQGKKLFEVAPLNAYRVILQIDEREIRHVQVGETGKLVISGIAGDPIPFTVIKVTPVATAQDGRNFFRAEARLAEAPPRLRPGMEGIGKISVGKHRLWWILTHSFTDWLRLTLWTWLP